MAEATEDELARRRDTPALHKTELFGDIANMMRRPRAHLPLYRHCMPRTPLAVQDAVFASRRVQDAITKVSRDSISAFTPSLRRTLGPPMRGPGWRRRREPSWRA